MVGYFSGLWIHLFIYFVVFFFNGAKEVKHDNKTVAPSTNPDLFFSTLPQGERKKKHYYKNWPEREDKKKKKIL